MSKISYNPYILSAKDYAKTEFIGTHFIQTLWRGFDKVVLQVLSG